MEIPKNQTEKPAEYYLEIYSREDPLHLSEKSGVKYENGRFYFTLLGRPLTLSWPEMEALYTDTNTPASHYVRLLVARLVLEGSVTLAGGQYLAYTDMPWGNVYSVQFRGRCINRLSGTYGKNPQGFENACLSIGGIKASYGDYSYDVPLFDGLTVRLILWLGDDEFPSSAQILFSDNFPNAFKAEDMAVAGDIILNAMKGRW